MRKLKCFLKLSKDGAACTTLKRIIRPKHGHISRQLYKDKKKIYQEEFEKGHSSYG